MKILLMMDPGISVPPKQYGGHERLVYSFAEEYIKLGHEVTLLAGPDSYCSGKTITYGINDLKRSKFQRAKEIFFVWRYLRRNKNNFDLVHNFGRLILLLPIINSPVKKIMSYGRSVTASGIRKITTLPNRNLIFTACSSYCANFGNVAGTWRIVYNAIDFSKYQLTQIIDEEAPLVFLSRLDKIKGPHVAINIALKTGDKLLIAGNKPTTPDDQAYYEEFVLPFIDQQQIIYVGEVNDEQKNAMLGKSKAMLFPLSGEEAFGLVMIEAMACGTPVIAFNHAAAPEVIDDGLTGFIVNTEDEMLKALDKIPQIDRDKCRQVAGQRFDVKVIAKQYLNLFNNDNPLLYQANTSKS
ncbi:MAG: glycosyltransferase [Bacteroidota bacterium]